ncbi:MAG: M20/M25/M40 family metallo-hydrolase [Bacteroidota bacterium]|nr:M20/M25/M40 family metallo-hydrolase [Bacteroidota bacterium]
MLRKSFLLVLVLFVFTVSFAQKRQVKAVAQVTVMNPMLSYSDVVSALLKKGLTEQQAYQNLAELTGTIGGRLSGSPQAARAVVWAKNLMEKLGFQHVRLQHVMVPHWVRGKIEKAWIADRRGRKNIPLAMCALGGSVATPRKGITAEVIEVHSLDEARALGAEAKGKIIFFNRRMNPTLVSTFAAYSGAVDQRDGGASAAASVGGVGALVRSMTLVVDNVPHTGVMHYQDSIPKVPTAALSTFAANRLSAELERRPRLRVHFVLDCKTLPDVKSANVIGELPGTQLPNEVVVMGGHLDSWDKGKGAHDDGAGVTQSIEALRLIKELGLKPKRTIRVVLFMNEENGSRGGKKYAAQLPVNEKAVAALESDAGGFDPRAFGVSADSSVFQKIASWASLLQPTDICSIRRGGGGEDISYLKGKASALIGLEPSNQRYFDYHHSDKDVLANVNPRELELGAVALASLAYFISEEGL